MTEPERVVAAVESQTGGRKAGTVIQISLAERGVEEWSAASVCYVEEKRIVSVVWRAAAM